LLINQSVKQSKNINI